MGDSDQEEATKANIYAREGYNSDDEEDSPYSGEGEENSSVENDYGQNEDSMDHAGPPLADDSFYSENNEHYHVKCFKTFLSDYRRELMDYFLEKIVPCHCKKIKRKA